MLCQARTEPASVAASLWISLPAVLSFLGWDHVTELAMDQHPISLLVACFGWLIICTVKCCLFSFAITWCFRVYFHTTDCYIVAYVLGMAHLALVLQFQMLYQFAFLKATLLLWTLEALAEIHRVFHILGFHLDVHCGHWNDTNLINAIFSW